ncbi:MAG: DeoR/GlpR transcriptional regulator [Desulfobulbus sp.]|nr:MAG: DeoR/GlpR transcriptional regulator [Desulfobulbus sp.]
MTPVERRSEIVKIIRKQSRVTVEALAKSLHISRETIRRDLTELANSGKVQKFHGGASLPMMTGEGPFRARMSDHVSAKVSIADQAVKLVSSGETLFIDTGSTTLYFAEKLAEIPDITVVTNSAEIARILSLSSQRTKIFLLGGVFKGDNRQTVGSMAISQIQSFRAHHAFLTVGAIDTRTGIMDFCIDEAQVAKAMIAQAGSLTVLADSSKFGRIASFEVCGLNQVSRLVCETPPTGVIKESLSEAGVTVVSVPGS